MENRLSPALIITVIALFVCAAMLKTSAYSYNPNAKRYLAPPPEKIEYFHFGFRDSIADSLWLRWIQDVDTCQTYKGVAAAEPIEGPAHGYEVPRHKVCDNSWGFKMLDSITKLSPHFEMPYLAGAVTLSVLVEDYEGAKIIFDRGIREFPNDWRIHYRAAYHYLFDRHDLPEAGALLARAEKAGGAPYWLPLLAARLYTKAGQLEMGISVLEGLKKSQADNPKAIKDIDNRIKELKERLGQ